KIAGNGSVKPAAHYCYSRGGCLTLVARLRFAPKLWRSLSCVVRRGGRRHRGEGRGQVWFVRWRSVQERQLQGPRLAAGSARRRAEHQALESARQTWM